MTIIHCEKCDGNLGTCCVTCGKERSRTKKESSSYRPREHRSCKRRPFGVVDCAGHADPIYRCDYCGLKEPASKAEHWGFQRPKYWTVSGALEACAACTAQLAVAHDSVAGMDVAKVGELALENISAGLARIDIANLSNHHAAHLQRAVDRAADELMRRAARIKHAKKHPPKEVSA